MRSPAGYRGPSSLWNGGHIHRAPAYSVRGARAQRRHIHAWAECAAGLPAGVPAQLVTELGNGAVQLRVLAL